MVSRIHHKIITSEEQPEMREGEEGEEERTKVVDDLDPRIIQRVKKVLKNRSAPGPNGISW